MWPIHVVLCALEKALFLKTGTEQIADYPPLISSIIEANQIAFFY